MTVTLELPPELEEVARVAAQVRGMSVEEYLIMLLEETLVVRKQPTAQEMDDFEADFDALANGSETLPILPLAANKRAYYYEED